MKGEIDLKRDVIITPLRRIYYDYLQKPIPEVEALENDLTKPFFYEIKWGLIRKYPINIAITGRVGSGKSISGAAIIVFGNRIICKIEGKKEPDYYKLILGNQVEFMRFAVKDIRNVFVEIDEYAKTAEIGANASTERTIYEYYSDVFAQRYVHRVGISPETVLDKNAEFILTFIARGKGFNRFKLSMREIGGGRMMPMVLGFVDIPIEEVLKSKFYKKYRQKKFRRMELLDKHKIKDIRELEIAEVILLTIEKLKSAAMLGKKVPHEVIVTAMEMATKDSSGLGIYSEFTKPMIVTHAKSILGLITEISKLRAILSKYTKEAVSNQGMKVKAKAEETYNEYLKMLQKTTEHWKKMARLYEEYMEDR